jgi:Copper binding proteins, plastocyanin/azurin family
VSLNDKKELKSMRRLLPVLAVLALLVPPSAFALFSATRISGTTGPDFTITLKKGGVKVKTLKPGKYTITVRDRSSMHDFVLTGPGIRKKLITGLGYTGTKSATVTLKRGRYEYYCSPHRSFGMKGFFRVR